MKLVTQATGTLVTTWTRGRHIQVTVRELHNSFSRFWRTRCMFTWYIHACSRDPDCRIHLPKVLMHSCSQPWSGLWRTLTQGVALMLAAVIRTVAYTYPRCWCTHARSRDPDCGVHLPKVLMHSCSQPWSGLWHSSYSFMKLAEWFNSVWYNKQFVYTWKGIVPEAEFMNVKLRWGFWA
jgi:hypothetical protein